MGSFGARRTVFDARWHAWLGTLLIAFGALLLGVVLTIQLGLAPVPGTSVPAPGAWDEGPAALSISRDAPSISEPTNRSLLDDIPVAREGDSVPAAESAEVASLQVGSRDRGMDGEAFDARETTLDQNAGGSEASADQMAIGLDAPIESSVAIPQPTSSPSPSPTPTRELTSAAIPAPSLPRPGWASRLMIPSIGLDTPVKQGGFVADANGEYYPETLPHVAVHYGWHTARVGWSGNAVISGHVVSLREGNVFQNLHKVREGSVVRVQTDEGAEFRYRVASVKLVRPDAVDVMQPTTDARLTLITCAGTFNARTRSYSHRLIVTAFLEQPAASAAGARG
jgi:LPXTG-site transpeptidase (sortase) family protein